MIVTDLSQDSCHARGLQARLLRCRRLWSTLHKGRQGCVLPGTSPIDSRGRLTWHAQKFETSLQTQRGQEGRSQNCWIRQFWRGASVRKNISLHLRKTFIMLPFKEVSIEGVVVGNVECGHTKRCAFLKIGNFKLKHLKLHTFPLTE